MNKLEAIAKAKEFILNQQIRMAQEVELVLLEDEIIEKSYGWIFLYDSKKFLKTDDMDYAILGNAPFLVLCNSGDIISFGTARILQYYIDEYESSRLP